MSSSDLPPPFPVNDHDLTTPEETAARQRRRRLILWGSVGAVVVVLGGLAALPTLRAVKGWQARRLASQALRLLATGHGDEGMGKVQDALTLRPTDPEVRRTAALFLTRVGHGREAAGFWREIEKERTLSRDEQRDYAAALLEAGDAVEARRRQRKAVPEGGEGTPADWALAMQLSARERDTPEAARLARRLADGRASGTTEPQRLTAALVLLSVDTREDQAAGLAALQTLAAKGGSSTSLEALLMLTRRAAQEIAADRARHQEVPETAAAALLDLAERIDKHPKAQTAQRLLALQARIVAQPAERAAILQQAVDRYGRGKNEERAELGSWLYGQGEFQRVLEVVTPAVAVGSRALYLQRFDALGALGRWEDIRGAIEGQKFTLEPTIEQMYLARCATQLRQPDAARVHWEAALRKAGDKPEALLSLGRYAAADGAAGTAEAAFRAATKTAPENRTARELLLKLLEEQGRTRDLRVAIQAMLPNWPEDLAVQNDNAYLGALLGEDLTEDRQTARELVRQEPGSLPHRITLALAEFRLGHALTALETLQAVDRKAYESQPKFLAVYAAVLGETGYEAEAAKMAGALPVDRLLPEERTLVAAIRQGSRGAGPVGR